MHENELKNELNELDEFWGPRCVRFILFWVCMILRNDNWVFPCLVVVIVILAR